jgi:hypothetical protein
MATALTDSGGMGGDPFAIASFAVAKNIIMISLFDARLPLLLLGWR